MGRPDQRPQPKPQPDGDCHDCPPGYKKCDIKLHGYMCCPEPCPPAMKTVIKHLPCNIEGEQMPAQLNNILAAHPGYVIQQVLDHGHDGWTVILTGPA